MKGKKKLTTGVALVTALSLLLGGTFAWQSISQTALNEKEAIVNPGGRLHDDFDGSNKDIYVENFADDEIFARVRLDEYFEIIINKGTGAEKTEKITADANKGEVNTYVTHMFGDDAENVTDAYWTWATGGSTVYMPTFNMNKDSLVADINGTKDYVNEGTPAPYGDYVDYSEVKNQSKTAPEIYDADINNVDEVGTDFDNLEGYVTAGNIEIVENVEHTVDTTLDAKLISMTDWLKMVNDAENGYNKETHGNYWVYDEDGWVYWSAPIAAHSATGCLLSGIELREVMDDSWYYAINVEAQFVTANDVGKGDGTGFYQSDAEDAPSYKAEKLLKTIGVDLELTEKTLNITNTKVMVSNGQVTVTADAKVNGKVTADTADGAVTGKIGDNSFTGKIADGQLIFTTIDEKLFHDADSSSLYPTRDLTISYTDADEDKLSATVTVKYAETLALNEEDTGNITLDTDGVNRVSVSKADDSKPNQVTVESEGTELSKDTDFIYESQTGLLTIINKEYLGKELTVAEYVDPTPATVEFYYEDVAVENSSTYFKVGVEDTLSLKFKNADGKEIKATAAIEKIMQNATFTLKSGGTAITDSFEDYGWSCTKSGSDLKMSIDQDYISDLTLEYSVAETSVAGSLELTPDFSEVYETKDANLLEMRQVMRSDYNPGQTTADLNSVYWITMQNIGTSWMKSSPYYDMIPNGLFKSDDIIVSYDENNSITNTGNVSFDENGVGKLSDGTVVCETSYPNVRCQRIKFVKNGYLRIEYNRDANFWFSQIIHVE